MADQAPFPGRAYRLEHPWEVAAYIGLGLGIAPLARGYIRLVASAEVWDGRFRRIPAWAGPAWEASSSGPWASPSPKP